MKFFNKQKYWFFSRSDKRLRYGDDRAIELGKTHWVLKKPKICMQGLHASVDLQDALYYSPGPILWQVELRGLKDVYDDKTCAMGRKYVAGGIDVSEHFLDVIYQYIPEHGQEYVYDYIQLFKDNTSVTGEQITEVTNKYFPGDSMFTPQHYIAKHYARASHSKSMNGFEEVWWRNIYGALKEIKIKSVNEWIYFELEDYFNEIL